MTARQFASASSQYAENAAYVAQAYPITLAGWFRTTSIAAAAYQRVATWENSSGNNVAASLLLNYPNGGDLANQSYSGSNYLPSVSGIVAHRWHHGMAVCTASAATIYLDGVQGSSTSAASPTGYTYLSVSNTKGGGAQFLSGACCEIVTWSIALGKDEAAAMFSGVNPLDIHRDKIISYHFPRRSSRHWHADLDALGAYNLTPYNTPTWADEPTQLRLRARRSRRVGVAAAATKYWIYNRKPQIIGGGRVA